MKGPYRNYIFSLLVLLLYFLMRAKLSRVVGTIDFWDIPFYPLSIIMLRLVLNMGFGMLLALNRFIDEKRKEGKWMINRPQALILGMPMVLFSLLEVFRYLPPRQGIDFKIKAFLEFNFTSIQLAQVLLGFIIINSLKKDSKNEEKVSKR